MATTEAQKRATYKYREKYTDIRCRVTKEEKDLIKTYAQKNNESVSSFIHRAIMEAIEKES